jgi:hypothetical protein
MKLYAYQPKGHGEQSFFTVANNEAEALENITRHIKEKLKEDKYNSIHPLGYSEFGSDYYTLTVVEPGEVIENDN